MEVGNSEKSLTVERRDSIYESLDSKVETVKGLVSICSKHVHDKDGNALLEELDKYEDNFLLNLSSKTKDGLIFLDRLDEEIHILRVKFDNGLENLENLEDIEEFEESSIQLDLKEKERYSTFSENNELPFVIGVRNFCRGIREKTEKVKLLKGKPEAIVKEIVEKEHLTGSENDVVCFLTEGLESIKYGPFWIGVVIEGEVYNEVFNAFGLDNGAYIRKTPIFKVGGRVQLERMISDFLSMWDDKALPPGEKRIEEVLNHELTHLALDGCASSYSDSDFGRFAVSQFKNLKDKSTGSIRDKKLLDFINYLNPNMVMNGLQGEFVADDISKLACDLATSSNFSLSDLADSNLPMDLFKKLSTGYTRLRCILDVFEEINRLDSIDQMVKDIANLSEKNFYSSIKKTFQSLLHSGYLVNKFGDKSFADFKALTYILDPRQYRHIPGFLEWKYKEKTNSQLNKQTENK